MLDKTEQEKEVKGGIARLKGLGRQVPKFGFCVLSQPRIREPKRHHVIKALIITPFFNLKVLNLAIWQCQNAAKV